MKALTTLLAVLALGLTPPCPAEQGLGVTFVVNDATVKGKVLPGVRVLVARAAGETPVASGQTGEDGRFSCTLPSGTYAVSYALRGYVPLADSPTEVKAEGQVITTTLSMMLEAEGSAGERRIRVILNWGSQPDQVRDADSHILCPCQQPNAHVYFAAKEHAAGDHRVDLDVDDTDWGGPETVTLHDPPPGTYRYWVYDYSGPPASLGRSDVVVRVLFGDTVAGEVHVPRTATARAWLPFKALVVGQDLRPRIEPFAPDELAAGADRVVPAGYETQGVPPSAGAALGCSVAAVAAFLAPVALLLAVAVILRRAVTSRRRRPPVHRHLPP